MYALFLKEKNIPENPQVQVSVKIFLEHNFLRHLTSFPRYFLYESPLLILWKLLADMELSSSIL